MRCWTVTRTVWRDLAPRVAHRVRHPFHRIGYHARHSLPVAHGTVPGRIAVHLPRIVCEQGAATPYRVWRGLQTAGIIGGSIAGLGGAGALGFYGTPPMLAALTPIVERAAGWLPRPAPTEAAPPFAVNLPLPPFPTPGYPPPYPAPKPPAPAPLPIPGTAPPGVVNVPEPSSAWALVAGIAGLAVVRRRRQCT